MFVRTEQKAMESRFQLLDDLFNADQKIRRASQHITSLNKKMAVLQHRYIMAKQAGDERFLYIFQNRMLVIEEMLNAYVKYADMKSKESIDLVSSSSASGSSLRSTVNVVSWSAMAQNGTEKRLS